MLRDSALARDSASSHAATSDRCRARVSVAGEEIVFPPHLLGPFEKKYGVKVTVWRAGTDKVLQRTLAEALRTGGLRVGNLVLFHHHPEHSDEQLDQLSRVTREEFPATEVAREGLELPL